MTSRRSQALRNSSEFRYGRNRNGIPLNSGSTSTTRHPFCQLTSFPVRMGDGAPATPKGDRGNPLMPLLKQKPIDSRQEFFRVERITAPDETAPPRRTSKVIAVMP